MAEKDLTSKMLESEPDVFADIFNTLLFQDESAQIVDPASRLSDSPTEGFYYDSNHNIHNMFQDIAKSYRDTYGGQSLIACFISRNIMRK